MCSRLLYTRNITLICIFNNESFLNIAVYSSISCPLLVCISVSHQTNLSFILIKIAMCPFSLEKILAKRIHR